MRVTGEEIAISLTRHEKELDSLRYRVEACEEENENIRTIALSVNKLAVNMEHMLTEQKEQGQRLTVLEHEPGESYRRIKETVVKCITSSLLGALFGAVMTLILR